METSVEYRLEDMTSREAKKTVDFSGDALNIDLLQKSNQFQETLDFESENPLIPETKLTIHGQDSVADDLLSSENTTTDYDWYDSIFKLVATLVSSVRVPFSRAEMTKSRGRLLSPPRNPVPSLEMEEQKILMSQSLISNGHSVSPESTLKNPSAEECTSKTYVTPKLPTSSNGTKSSNGTIRQPSPSRKAAPSSFSSSTQAKKPFRSSTPTSRATKPESSSKRSTTPTCNSIRSSTATPRTSVLPTTSKSKSTSRSSTPTTRPVIIATSKSTSRSSTPTTRPSNPSGLPTTYVNGNRPSSARGSSPSVKSRPMKNPPEIKKSLPERSSSASKIRPGLPALKLPVNEANSKAVPKRASCSPSRAPASNVGANNNNLKPGPTRSRGYSNGDDDVNPVLMGTKMVERVVNMRKLAPPKQENVSSQNIMSGKLSVSQDNTGFGRTLSKKSFDMALRHLDIRRSMPGHMRATITKVPASFVYSVRSESTKSQTIDSPLATSSSASSDK